MVGLEIRELECFLVLADELHFGRTGERLYISQSRVSQLIGALERRVGARLVSRTSRSVRLTPLGKELRDALEPAYGALRAVVEGTRDAARSVSGCLRLGFQGTADDRLLAAVTHLPRIRIMVAPWSKGLLPLDAAPRAAPPRSPGQSSRPASAGTRARRPTSGRRSCR